MYGDFRIPLTYADHIRFVCVSPTVTLLRFDFKCPHCHHTHHWCEIGTRFYDDWDYELIHCGTVHICKRPGTTIALEMQY